MPTLLFGLLITLFTFVCLLLVLLILIQRGKGSSGLGSFYGGTQMLFGGSGGQDLFQKTTWVLGAFFMAGSLGLSILKTKSINSAKYLDKLSSYTQQAPASVQQTPQ